MKSTSPTEASEPKTPTAATRNMTKNDPCIPPPTYIERYYESMLKFKSCRIQNNDFSDDDAKQLSTKLLCTTTTFKPLRDNYADDFFFFEEDNEHDLYTSRISTRTSSTSPLRMLEIGKCPKLSPRGVTTLLDAMTADPGDDTTATSFNISNLQLSYIQNIDEDLLDAIQQCQSLSWLGLNHCTIDNGDDKTDDNMWRSFIHSLIGKDNTTLKTLDLFECGLTKTSIQDLADALQNDTTLENLILSGNMIDESTTTMDSLCKALKSNKSLKTLSIANCHLSTESVEMLISCISQHNTTIQKIYHHSNQNVPKKKLKELDYWLELNRSGRSLLRQDSFQINLFPYLLVAKNRTFQSLVSRTNKREEEQQEQCLNNQVYGLLRELPHLYGHRVHHRHNIKLEIK